MSEGALSLIRRVALGSESSIYGSLGSVTNPRGLEDVSFSAVRESLADNRQRTSRKDGHASHLGPKKAELSFKVPVHDAVHTDLDVVFTNAAGTKLGTSALVFSAGGASTITVSSGTFAGIVLATVGSAKYARPVKSVSTNVATLGIQLPGSATAVENPAACYKCDPTATPATLGCEVDRDSETDTVTYTASGMVCDRLAIDMDLSGRLMLDVHMMGGDWAQASPANTAAPSALSGQFLGYAAEFFLQDLGSPATGTQIDVHGFSANLAPNWIARNATRAPGTSVPGSPISGWKQGIHFSEPIKLTVTKAAASYVTARTNKTAYTLFASWSLGGPGATTTDNKMALWFPRVVLTEDPTPVDIDGIEGMELTLQVEEEALSSPYLFPYELAFFS